MKMSPLLSTSLAIPGVTQKPTFWVGAQCHVLVAPHTSSGQPCPALPTGLTLLLASSHVMLVMTHSQLVGGGVTIGAQHPRALV